MKSNETKKSIAKYVHHWNAIEKFQFSFPMNRPNSKNENDAHHSTHKRTHRVILLISQFDEISAISRNFNDKTNSKLMNRFYCISFRERNKKKRELEFCHKQLKKRQGEKRKKKNAPNWLWRVTDAAKYKCKSFTFTKWRIQQQLHGIFNTISIE